MRRLAGIYPILQTPFDDDGAVDLESLRREVSFCLRARAHGVVIPAIASEFFMLSDAERLQVTEATLEAVGGRVPVVIGCSGVSVRAAVAFTRHAVAHGADAIMVLPPYVRRVDEAGLIRYCQAVAIAAEGRPVIVQNADPPMGTPLSIPTLVRLIQDTPGVHYVKEEVMPGGHRMTALIEAADDRLHGVFGGQDGLWMLNELDRGACGNMPASGLVDVHVRIFTLYREGQRADAEALSAHLLPLLNLGSQYGVGFAKELLWRRGVIRTRAVRDPRATPLDRHDLAELERFLDAIRPSLTVAS